MDRPIVFAARFDPLHAHATDKSLLHGYFGQAVFPDKFDHFMDHFVMLFPLAFQRAPDGPLCFGVDQVKPDVPGLLPEPQQTVNRLNKVIELEADAEKDCPRAMLL